MNMQSMLFTPGANTMIRMDHTHVIATFHRYRLDASPEKKRAIADLICAALEIHARLEEEIFYPAMRRFDTELIDKSVPEHNEMRRLIARLGELQPQDLAFDATVLELMRSVIRHVADEETILLPDAERVLGADKLHQLGMQMKKRRFELAGPRAGEMAVNTVRAYPVMTLAATGVLALVAFAAGWVLTRPSRATLAMPSAVRNLVRPSRMRSATRAVKGRLAALAG